MPLDLDWIDQLSPEVRQALLAEADAEVRRRKLERYRPYPKQREFHAQGARYRERLLRAGNQNGKTFCLAAEAAYHLTGLYPEDWPGKRFSRPIVAWASSETGESTRDNPQRALLGLPGEEGTGMIPGQHLGLAQGQYGMATGVADLYDFIKVKHHTNGRFDGWSLLRFKYYAQGRRKWQGPPVDFVWFDEEPPEDIYDEGLARTIATGGIAALSFTPLMGMSNVVLRFLGGEKSADRAEVNMTIEDALHIPQEDRSRIVASFPAHEREARARGIPVLGSGRIFPVEESLITTAPFPIPAHWPRIAGIDFGWDHPTAVGWLAWDRDADTVYLYDCYRRSQATVQQHAAVLRAKGLWIPVAWPHDGLNDTAVGPQLAQQYKDEGVAMRPENAKFPEGMDGGERSRTSVEAGIAEMLGRMETGRFKVFNTMADFFAEFRLYHRKDGRIVKENDDLISAVRYGLMDLRHAKVKPTDTFDLPEPEVFDPTVGW